MFTNLFKNKKILVIGGAGSIGSELVRQLVTYNPTAVRVLDNNETGLFDLQHQLDNPKLRFLIGDIRDVSRLKVAMEDIDYVFNAAAFKHVHYSEYNPFETVRTNIIGTQNVINAALAQNVKKVISISTDKAVNPVNTMGATKLLTEKLITAANFYKAKKRTVFSSVRFGNVIGSRGSVIPLFINQIKKGKITLTSREMTRFIMSLEEAIKLILKATEYAKGGEVFVLKMSALKIVDLAEVLIEMYAPKFSIKPNEVKIEIIGKRPGEKYHEELITDEERAHILKLDDLFVILPSSFDERLLKYLGYKTNYKLCNISRSEYLSNEAKYLDKREIENILRANKLVNNSDSLLK